MSEENFEKSRREGLKRYLFHRITTDEGREVIKKLAEMSLSHWSRKKFFTPAEIVAELGMGHREYKLAVTVLDDADQAKTVGVEKKIFWSRAPPGPRFSIKEDRAREILGILAVHPNDKTTQ